MMQNLTMVEIENEVLRSRYARLKEEARFLAQYVENNLRRTPNREPMFQAVENIKRMTK